MTTPTREVEQTIREIVYNNRNNPEMAIAQLRVLFAKVTGENAAELVKLAIEKAVSEIYSQKSK